MPPLILNETFSLTAPDSFGGARLVQDPENSLQHLVFVAHLLVHFFGCVILENATTETIGSLVR